jgi:capsular exopolysaccharide synthesis family protein
VLDEALQSVPEIPNLSILPAGSTPPNPVDLIASDRTAILMTTLRGRFDHIVIDSAPTIPYSDTRMLSSLIDAVILVARYGLTTRRALTRCAELLQEVHAPLVGVVLNGINLRSADYQYYNYGFSRSMNGYRYYESQKPAQDALGGTTQPPSDEPKKKSAHA